MVPKTEKRPFLADFFIKYKHIAWSDIMPRIKVLKKPIRFEKQEHNRYRFWAAVEELDDRFLRVVTLEDKITIHNAFPDRRFKP